jgi:hypothetical protein
VAGVRVLFSWVWNEAKGDRWLRLGDVASHDVIVVRCPWDGGSAKFMEESLVDRACLSDHGLIQHRINGAAHRLTNQGMIVNNQDLGHA